MSVNWADFKPIADANAPATSEGPSGVDWGNFKPISDASPTLADYAKGAASGVNQLVSGVGYLAERSGATNVGKYIRDIGDTGQRYWSDSMTPAGRRAAESQVFEDDPNSVIPSLGERPLQALAMGTAQSAPSMFAAAVPGGIAAAGLRGVAGMAASRGIGGAIAPIAAGAAAPIGGWGANFAGNLAARVPSALGFGAAEGAIAGASNAAQWKSDIEQMPLDELRNMQGFAEIEGQIGEQAARQQIAEQGASDILRNTTISTGGIGALTGGGALGSAFQRVTTGAKGGLFGAVGRDAAKEAGQELLQSGGERAVQNIATRDYLDQNQSVIQGVVSDALSGAAVGGVMGGVAGGGSHLVKGPLQKAAEASSATVPPDAATIPPGGQTSATIQPEAAQPAGIPAGTVPADPETQPPAAGIASADQNTPAAPGISPVQVSTAEPPLPSNQAESAGVPVVDQQAPLSGEYLPASDGRAPFVSAGEIEAGAIPGQFSRVEPDAGQRRISQTRSITDQSQEGAAKSGNETEIPQPAEPGQQAKPASVSDSARLDWEKDAEALATKAARLREMATRAVGQNRIRLTDLAGRMEAAREAIVGQAGATNKDSLTVEGKAPAVTSQSPPGNFDDAIDAVVKARAKLTPIRDSAESDSDAERTNALINDVGKASLGDLQAMIRIELASKKKQNAGVKVELENVLRAGSSRLRQRAIDAVKSVRSPDSTGDPWLTVSPVVKRIVDKWGQAHSAAAMSAGNVGDTLQTSGSEKPKSDSVVRIRTVYGDHVYVRQSDLDGTRRRIPMFRASGEELTGKWILRENLDPDGSKQREMNKQGVQDIIGADHDRKAFATEAAAKREAGKRGVGDTHAIVPASDVSPGAAGFVLRRKQDPAATAELDDFIASESADLAKRRSMILSLQEIRKQKQIEAADKTELDALIKSETKDLRERLARLRSAQAAAKARNPFVIPALTTPAQPTTHGAPLEQKAAEIPIGKYAKAKPVGNADKLPAADATPSETDAETKQRTIQDKIASAKRMLRDLRNKGYDVTLPEKKKAFLAREAAIMSELRDLRRRVFDDENNGQDAENPAAEPDPAPLTDANVEPLKNPEELPAKSAKLNYDEASTPKEAPNDSADQGGSPSLDQPMAEGQRPDNPIRGAVTPRSRPRRTDDRGVRGAGRRADGSTDESKPLGDGGRSAAVSDGTDGVVAGGVRRVSADFRPGLGALTREGSWFDAAKRNIDLIELAIQIDKEKRNATTEEQAQLAKYVGFGASEIRNALFPIPGEYAKRLEPNRLVWPNLVRDARWKPLAERIDALPLEWQKSILQSTQYAHYTSEGIIRSIWSAIQRLGFTGGNIFEPGTGIGSFSMLMPDGIHETSRFTGVEFDAPTALIARLLSPDQQIHHDDFIKRKFPKNYFDVNVGNPPFSQTKILGDAEYAKHGFMLHDFFFAKGIDLVRPGGLQVFVTSKGTMDKKTDRARKFLSDRADLIGAIRLPSTAFEGNAGTSVVTDVIFLKKRAPGEAPGGMAWGAIKTVDTKDGPVEVNEYFADHPEMILGQQRISGNIDDLGRRVNSNGYGGEKYTVVSYDSTPAELDAKFAEAVERLPENVYSPLRQSDEAVKAETRKVDFDPSVKREGVIYLDKDGAILRVSSGVGVPLDESVKLSDKDRAWLKGYVGIRDLVQAARLAQVTDGDWKAALRALNKAYDAFRAERGPILDFRTQVRKSTDEDGNIVETESRIFKNKRLYREDYDSALLTSLESISESGEIVKAPFLLGRTIGKPVVVEVKGIGDALAVSLDSIGSLDLADVGRRIGLSMEDTIEALGNQIYRTPAGQWQLADEYLSGDVVTKLEEAEHLARSNPDYRRNVEALKEVQPEKLGPSQISVKLGAAWVPVEHVNEFAKEIGAGHVTFDIKTETWQVEGGNRRTERKAGAEYGTTARSASELLEASLNSRSIKVTAVVDKKTVTDVKATTAANEMAKKIKDKFKRWVWTDSNRASELVEAYNKRFNNIAPRKFDGSHLTLPGVSLRFKLHPHQLRSIWRQIQTGNTYLAHAVGAGKTIEMIAGAMEQKRLGLIKKPMFVVPNHMLEQFSNEFMELYPLANIMVADDENFSAERRKAFVASATLNSPDAIIITHSAFKRIGVTEASVAPIRNEIVTDLELELSSLAEDQGTRVRRSQLEQQIEAVNQRFDAILGASGKGSTIKFEDIGADFIYADEAHAFRKLDFHTAQQIKGIDPNGSQAAMDMYVKTRILERARPGRAFVFASGTPVTNTMGELFTIMRFFAPQEMELSGISTFDSWARQFGEVAPALEPNAAGKYELIERFAKFDNVPELMSRVRQFMDVLTSESLGALVKRPNLSGGKPNLVVVEPTKALEAYMKGELSRRIEASKAWKPSPGEMSNPDPIVSIITDGRFAAIDPRFFGAELEGESIITKMASNVVAKYHATKENVYHDKEGNPAPIKGSTQIVFYNLGFGEQSQRSRGFNSRAAFTKLLTDGGIPRDEIAWFDDANTDAKKEAIFKDMRSGKLKVLIGSAKKMGTGVNVQNRLIALHYQDPPWFPADVEQPHGRIIRQGNLNQEVSIDWYTTKGTYQSTMWQMVGRKQRFIDQAFTGDKSLRSMDDMGEASLFEQAAAVASGDPRALQLAGLRQDVERFERLQAAHASEQINIRTALRSAEWGVEHETKRIVRFSKAFKAIGERYFQFDSGAVDGRTYSKTGEFGQALKDAFNRATRDRLMDMAGGDSVQLATIGSAIKITMEAQIDKNKPTGSFSMYVEIMGLQLHVVTAPSLGEETDATGLARKVFNQINSIDSSLRTQRANLATNEADIIRLNKKLGAPFEYQQEMAEKYGELKRLEAELQGEVEKVAVPPSAGKKQGQEQDNPIQQAALSGALLGERQLARYDYQDVMARESGALPGESRFNQASGRAASTADRAVYDMAQEGKSAAEILEFIGKASRRPFNRYLANALKILGASSTITLDSQGDWRFGNTSRAQKYAAAYNSRTDTVALFTAREAERHILHELVHAATMKAIKAGWPAAVRMRALFKHVQKSGKVNGQYGMSNLDEFVAEAFTNPKFQEALKGVPAPAGSTLKSAWQWFVNIVARVLGFKTSVAKTALDRAMTIGAQLMRENAGIAAEETRYSIDGSQPSDGREVATTPLKPGTTTLMVDGTERPALNSNGKPIHWSEEGVRNFWRWFSGSKVVDAQGRPLVVYHGSPDIRFIKEEAIFKSQKDRILLGRSEAAHWFSSDKRTAKSYADPRRAFDYQNSEEGVIESYLRIENPLVVHADGQEWKTAQKRGKTSDVIEEARASSKDGVIINNVRDDYNNSRSTRPTRTFTVFESTQIKSSTGNTGAFSPTDPDIRYSLATDWQKSPVAREVAKAFKAAARSDAKLSWLNPVQTQYHKAERLAQQGKFGFKRVFDLGQKFLSDISRFAIQAENSAPTLFHQIRSFADAKQAVRSALGGDFGGQHNADIKAIAAPLYEGTLYGGADPTKGIVWSDDQLRGRFGLTDRQITLYREAREAVKSSMDELAKALITRHAKRENVMVDPALGLQEFSESVRDMLNLRASTLDQEAQAKLEDALRQAEDLREAGGKDNRDKAKAMEREANNKARSQKDEAARIRATAEDVMAIAEKAQNLQDAGYFPLMRFGRHTVTAKDADGKVQHFSMHDGIPLVPRSGQAQANRLADALREEHPEWTVTTGLMNPEKYKLYQGMNVDALQLFADHLDDETRNTYQEIIRLATNERSALRRMLKREGTPGFDRDARRTLASFILSNARYTSSVYHLADMAKAAELAELDGGDVGAEAVKLYDYVTKPQEEAAKLRSFLFFNFLGGSLASAMVNATQVPMMTFPRLSQYEDAGKLAKRLVMAAKMAMRNPADISGVVGDALRRAEADGVTAPHQIYEMTATASANVFGGSRAGSALLRAWGAPFALAEAFNRRTTFIAAFQIAQGMTESQLRDTGAATAFEFAENMVNETQGIYNRGNRMNIGRGVIGATVMTFKQYSVMYLEMFSRLPAKQKAIMAGVLILAAGSGGLPFAEDIEDIIDTIGQWLGYRTNARRTIRRGLSDMVGQQAADVAMNGVLSQLGIDLHSRLGLQNLIPGTALIKPSTTDKGREFQDLLGPAASVVAAMGQALQDLATGHPDRAAMEMAPTAFRNLAQGAKMAAKGYSEDAKGRKGVPVSEAESVAKMVGFNPKRVADYGAVKRDLAQDQRLVTVKREEFSSAIADAILANDPEARAEVVRAMREWNAKNPDARVSITAAAIGKRVRDARAEGADRMLRALPKSMRGQAREELAR